MAAKNGKLLKPKMLKEFLLHDNGGITNFENSTLLEESTPAKNDNNNESIRLSRSRSRSRAAANAAVSSFQKVLNAVKTLHQSSPTPSTLQRSVSRRLLGKWNVSKKRLKKNNNNNNNNSSEVVSGSKIMVVSVKVKDILRWRSFRDVVNEEDQSQPLDTVIVGGGSTEAAVAGSSSSSNSSVDSDFTAVTEEELPWWTGGEDDDAGKKWDEVVASDTEVGPTEDYHKTESEEGTEQQSPVSVLDSPFRDEVSDHEEYHSTFDRSLANMERTKQRFLQSIQLFESLAGVHDEDDEEEEELANEEDDIIDTTSKAYLNRGFCWFKRGEESLKEKKECIRGMEIMHGKWNKFEEERSEVGVELEVAVLNDLLDEVLFDL